MTCLCRKTNSNIAALNSPIEWVVLVDLVVQRTNPIKDINDHHVSVLSRVFDLAQQTKKVGRADFRTDNFLSPEIPSIDQIGQPATSTARLLYKSKVT